MEDLTLEELEQRQIDGVEVSPYDVRLLVLSYLLHHCYVDTAQAFIEACNLQEEGKRLCIAVQQRKDILNLVQMGKIEEAIGLIHSAFPQLLNKNPEVRFKLLCQRFIELIRQRKKEEALIFAQKEWSPHVSPDNTSLSKELQDVFALIAYEDPETSPINQYLAEDYKDKIACIVNSAILEHHGLSGEAALEAVLRHLSVLRQIGPASKSTKKPAWSLREFLDQQHDSSASEHSQ